MLMLEMLPEEQIRNRIGKEIRAIGEKIDNFLKHVIRS
jgi:hypothetical protein